MFTFIHINVECSEINVARYNRRRHIEQCEQLHYVTTGYTQLCYECEGCYLG